MLNNQECLRKNTGEPPILKDTACWFFERGSTNLDGAQDRTVKAKKMKR